MQSGISQAGIVYQEIKDYSIKKSPLRIWRGLLIIVLACGDNGTDWPGIYQIVDSPNDIQLHTLRFLETRRHNTGKHLGLIPGSLNK